MAVIELADVDKKYGKIHALRSLTATVEAGVIGLLGPNGAGKSTLLKCLLGLVRCTGRAAVLGLPCQTDSFRIRDRVGYMPEMDAYLSGLTAVELCTYAAELSGLPRSEAIQRAHAALYYAGLEDKRYQKVEGYSTGLKQRVKLAQALVHDPELLFLDEPTNGLDPRAREEMLELIAELPDKRGCSVVLSTHLLPDVDRLCDRVLILHMGQLLFSGSMLELRLDPSAGELMFEVEILRDAGAFAERLEDLGCKATADGERDLVVSLPAGTGSHLLFEVARDQGNQIRQLQMRRETLEKAFLRIVGVEL